MSALGSVLGSAAEPTLAKVATGLLLGAASLVALGLACVLVRTILPRLAEAADRSRARLGTARLWLTGLLPIAGAALLVHAARLAGGEPLAQAAGLALGLPLLAAALVGLLAAVPHLGAALLGGARAPWAEASAGAFGLGAPFLLGLAVPALALVLGLLVGGWCVGIGIGCALGPRLTTREPGS